MDQIKPAYHEDAVSVCFYCDNYYVKYTGTALYSLIKHTTARYNHVNYMLKNYDEAFTKEEVKRYLEGKKQAFIIHYAGIKPWKDIHAPLADIFFSYARETVWYEQILLESITNSRPKKRIRDRMFPEHSVQKRIGRRILSTFFHMIRRCC